MQSMKQIFRTCACIFKGTVHNSLQKAGLSSRCMILSKKNTAVFSGSTFLKFQLRFHAQSVLIPCKCVIFFNKAAPLRQNIDDAWKRSRFNRQTIF